MTEELDFSISYRFDDYLDPDATYGDPNDFVTEVHFEVHQVNEFGAPMELAAKGHFSHILFSLAMDSGYPLLSVMDASQSILEMSEVLFEWDEHKDFWDKLDDYFEDHPPIHTDVCFLESLEILPAFRKKGLTKMVLRDLARKYHHSCGLWVLKVFPLQHKSRSEEDKKDAWYQKMRYDELEEDFEKSKYKLFHLYQSLGLVNPFEEAYFLARPENLAI